MTAKIEALRPAAAAPERSAEREALAAAIGRDAELEAEIARTEEALSKARGLAAGAEREISTLEERLAEAREGAPRRLVSALLAGEAAEHDPAEAIEAALVKARASLETSERAIAMLVEQHRGLTGRRVFSGVERCIGAVLRAEAFPALINRFKAMQHEVAEMSLMFAAIHLHAPPDFHHDGVPEFRDLSRRSADAWQLAVAALAADADAPLPTIEAPGDAPTAA